MDYKVLEIFADSEGDGKGNGTGVIYDPNGDNIKRFTQFPTKGVTVSKARLQLLASDQNNMGKAVIEYVEKPPKQPKTDDDKDKQPKSDEEIKTEK